MENSNQNISQEIKKSISSQISQFKEKPFLSFTKYVSKKQIIIIGVLFSLIAILLAIAAVTKKLPQKEEGLGENGFEEVSQSTVQLSISAPEKTMETFLNLVKQNSPEQAKTLISSKAALETFKDAFTESDSLSLYGKDFTFKIQNTTTEVPGTIAYVNVEIIIDNQSTKHFFTLLKDRDTGVWQLVKNEVFAPVSSERQE